MKKITKFFLGNREPAYSDKLNTQLLLAARFIVGSYLLYTSYGLKGALKGAETTGKFALFLAFMLLFSLTGVLLCYASGRDFIIGRYQGGKLDLGDRIETADENTGLPDEESGLTDEKDGLPDSNDLNT